MQKRNQGKEEQVLHAQPHKPHGAQYYGTHKQLTVHHHMEHKHITTPATAERKRERREHTFINRYVTHVFLFFLFLCFFFHDNIVAIESPPPHRRTVCHAMSCRRSSSIPCTVTVDGSVPGVDGRDTVTNCTYIYTTKTTIIYLHIP